MLYAYRARLVFETDPDPQDLDDARVDVINTVGSFGGDPLWRQAANAQVATDDQGRPVLVALWRLKVPPNSELLRAVDRIRSRASGLVGWSLEYHRCGNGRPYPCEPWQTLETYS